MAVTSEHRGIAFTVSEDAEAGFFKFEFLIDGQTVTGRKETKLLQLAVRKVETEIDRQFKKRGLSARPRTKSSHA